MVKAVREAKVHTEWLKPDSAYEEAVIAFVNETLNEHPANRFLKSLDEFGSRTAFFGMLNSLSQTMLKLTAPGIPDIYQGTELWDLSLVDPDNRRPVDFSVRNAMLDDVTILYKKDPSGCWNDLLRSWTDGRVKLLLIARSLAARTKFAEVFSSSSYIPLRSHGVFGRNCAAFLRRKQRRSIVVAVARFFTKLVKPPAFPLGREVWKDTRIELKEGSPSRWVNDLTGEQIEAGGGEELFLADVFRTLPVALLSCEEA
jgi:(1->4)-alpha-D-glucan 1-alpha-D-glucosylmutase